MNESNFANIHKIQMKQNYKLNVHLNVLAIHMQKLNQLIFCIVTVECTISNIKKKKDETNEMV